MSDYLFGVFPDKSFIDLDLYQFGWEQCEPLQSYGPHVRNHYLFHYVISGTGVLYSEDSNGKNHQYHVRSGQGFLICPGQTNTYLADEEHPWQYAWIEFDGLCVKEILDISGLSYNNPIYKSNDAAMAQAMKNELVYIAEHAHGSAFHLIGHTYLVLDYLTRSSSTRKEKEKGRIVDFYIREAMNYIEQNFHRDITVHDIADFCNLNRSYFGKVFKDAIGRTPQEFLIEYRMRKSTELLNYTDMSIRDIGIAVGYPNQLHFSRAFKKVYGLSPRNWKNENRPL